MRTVPCTSFESFGLVSGVLCCCFHQLSPRRLDPELRKHQNRQSSPMVNETSHKYEPLVGTKLWYHVSCTMYHTINIQEKETLRDLQLRCKREFLAVSQR